MYQQLGTPPGTPLSWSEAWTKALTKPSEETYVEIASDPNASSGRGLTWVFIVSIVGAIISFVLRMIFGNAIGTPPFGGNGFGGVTVDTGTLAGASVIALICAVPVAAVLGVLLFAVFVWITNVVAKALGGTGTFDKLLYTTAAYTAPLSLVSSVIGSIPVVNCIGVVVAIYGLVLNVMAVKAVHQFSWGKAIMSAVVIWVVLGILFVVCVLALLGPAIGNIFSNITRSI